MCGIMAIVSDQNVNQDVFDALTVLQHRGQDAAGMALCDGQKLSLRKGNGLVRDVFRTRHMRLLQGKMAIGHVRYPTQGTFTQAEAQPFYVNSPYGLTLAHNGNLTNAQELKAQLYKDDLRHLNTTSDSEILLNVFAHELQKLRKLTPCPDDFFAAVTEVYRRCRGAFAVVAMIAGYGVVAFRDPFGIRPLIYGKKDTQEKTAHMVASESVALSTEQYDIIEDIQPGEAIFIRHDQTVFKKQCTPKQSLSPCLFEFVYFARPDSFIDNISVYKVRMSLGKKLARKILEEWAPHDIDVVIPVPETSCVSALSLAQALQVKYREGFVKNRYIGRTFIMPGQAVRKKSVHKKLNAMGLEFQGKVVLIVDDSIVRGTTSREIVQMARQAGAQKVYFASAAPPIKFPNIYGIDMPKAEELIAHERNLEEIKAYMGADKLIFADLQDLVKAAQEGNPSIEQFEASVFDGHYLTGNETEYLRQAAFDRSNEKTESKLGDWDSMQMDF